MNRIVPKIIGALWNSYNDLTFGEMQRVAQVCSHAADNEVIKIRQEKNAVLAAKHLDSAHREGEDCGPHGQEK